MKNSCFACKGEKKEVNSFKSDKNANNKSKTSQKVPGYLKNRFIKDINGHRDDGKNESPGGNVARELDYFNRTERISILKEIQRTHGNQYVQRMMGIQAKLKISEPGDIYEQEADRVAEQVMRISEPGKIQLKCPEDESCPLKNKSEKKNGLVQLKTDQSTTGKNDAQYNPLNDLGPGQPLDRETRDFMEPRFGQDFSQVRIHNDARAADSAGLINAMAYAVGQDVVFGKGHYVPGSRDGKQMIAHELTHVIQQTGDLNKNTGNLRINRQAPPPVAAPADKELISPKFAGNAVLKDVLNRRKLLLKGSQGEAVKLVQEALLEEGYELPKFGADGKFGSETAKAVREFQERWKLSLDGIVGDQTLGLLDKHLSAKGLLLFGEVLPGFIGGIVKKIAGHALDTMEKDYAKTACPAANKTERLAAVIQPVVIANDDGTSPTAAPSMALSQRIWEKCCINYSVLGTKVVNKTSFRTLDESPTDVPTAEETALFTAAGGIKGIQVFVPENFEQGGVIGKNISGGGATYDSATDNPKVVVVEGAVPAVVAHEIGHASGHVDHDANPTVMKPTGAFNVPNTSAVSADVCTKARTGAVLIKIGGRDGCCMFLK